MFVLDYGASYCANSVTMRNTHNAYHHDRGTDAYRIETSLSSSTSGFVQIAAGNLPDARNVPCGSIPLITQDISGQIIRYVRFIADSHYGYGAGLQYFKVQ